MERLSDLDELILRCRSENAKRYLDEAVRSYRAGAFRAAVVMTWIAVLYDFIDKLRELDLTGDARAGAKVKEFEELHRNENLEGLLKFERQMLASAKDEFEFISALEYEDLDRLQRDRHRCAHPSLSGSGEAYQPSAELARVHLRNAVLHALQHPPVQGKAALDRLCKDVESEYFPASRDEAMKIFHGGPLARPRDVLVRNFALATLKSALDQELTQRQVRQRLAALGAVLSMHREVTERIIRQRLCDLIMGLPDNRLGRVVSTLATVPELQEFLRPDVVTRLSAYARALPEADLAFVGGEALDVEVTREEASQRITGLDVEGLSTVLQAGISSLPKQVCDRVVELYQKADSFDTANRLGKLVVMCSPYLMGEHVKGVFAAVGNSQVRESHKLGTVLSVLQSQSKLPPGEWDEQMRNARLDEDFTMFMHTPQTGNL